MPIVRVEMFPGRTHSQKAELARAITEAVVTIAHTTPEQTFVIFDDVFVSNERVFLDGKRYFREAASCD